MPCFEIFQTVTAAGAAKAYFEIFVFIFIGNAFDNGFHFRPGRNSYQAQFRRPVQMSKGFFNSGIPCDAVGHHSPAGLAQHETGKVDWVVITFKTVPADASVHDDPVAGFVNRLA